VLVFYFTWEASLPRKNTLTPLVAAATVVHYFGWSVSDIMDNILCQTRGTKRVILFPPSEIRNLYFSPVA